MTVDTKAVKQFQGEVRGYYAAHARQGLPWRLSEPDGSFDPYKILVSELMLQQTQVQRVIPKYHEFLERFPDVGTLAGASVGDVLKAWSGLGYNRRAKYLWQAAGQVQAAGWQFPATSEELTKLPGVGAGTAGAILAYAFNQPVAFVETNIRTVYIHHFFKDQAAVADKAILRMVDKTLDTKNPREFYWALMDYGSHLKQTVGNKARASKSYAKQSPFEGSKRQVRGRVLHLLARADMNEAGLQAKLADPRTAEVLQDLVREGLIRQDGADYSLA